jgi:UMF1 family MFS transporter
MGRERSLGFFARVNVFAIALSATWTPMNALILPDRVDALFPAAIRATALGLILLIGVGTAAAYQPVAGRMSDNWPTSDRRRPLIAFPAIAAAGALLVVAAVPWAMVLLLGLVIAQVAMNTAQAGFQGLIPDLAGDDATGRASGVKTAFDVGGVALGAVAAAAILAVTGHDVAVVAVLSLIIAVCAGLTWVWVPRPRASRRAQASLRSLLSPRAAWQEGREALHANVEFKSAVLVRLLFLLGVYPAQQYLLFYLEDAFGVDDPVRTLGWFLLLAILLGAAAAFVAGLFADRLGRAPVVRASVVVGVVGMVGIAVAPLLPVLAVAGAVAAIGLGAFQSVNWTQVADTIPDGKGAQYFSIANIATAGASALAGLFGPLADVLAPFLPFNPYRAVFALAAGVALAALAIGRRGGRESR